MIQIAKVPQHLAFNKRIYTKEEILMKLDEEFDEILEEGNVFFRNHSSPPSKTSETPPSISLKMPL